MSSRCSWTSSRIAKKSSARRASETARQVWKASFAAWTAASTSSTVAKSTAPGLLAGRRVPDRAAAPRRAVNALASDPVVNRLHGGRCDRLGHPWPSSKIDTRSVARRIRPMAVTESRQAEGEKVVAEDRQYLIHSWSVQSALNPLPVAGAEGRYFWDYTGKRYLDFASQLVNVSIGHQHPKLVAAIKEQADRLCTIAPGVANDKRSELARLIAESMPGDLNRTFFTNGGAEANENAIKLARWVTGRHKVDRPLPLVPRCDRRRDHAHRRPAALVRRAGHAGGRADVRPVHVPLPGRPPRPVPGLLRRPAPRGDPHVRGPAHGRGRDPRDGDGDERDHRPARRLPAVDPRGLRPARHPADPRRGDGGLGPHRPLVRVRPLGRRPGHHHDREGDQLRLRPARRDDRPRPRLRGDQGQVLRRRADLLGPPARLRGRRRVDRGLPRGGHRRERGRDGRVRGRGAAAARRATPVASARSAAWGSSGASSSSATGRRASRSSRSTPAARRPSRSRGSRRRAWSAASTRSSTGTCSR